METTVVWLQSPPTPGHLALCVFYKTKEPWSGEEVPTHEIS
jgi:hypothetical protein